MHFNLHGKLFNLKHSSHKFKEIWCLEILSYWGVNGFGLISGFVGYKKYKFSNLLYIWIEVFFYSILISFTEKMGCVTSNNFTSNIIINYLISPNRL